eukprot:3925612-Prymnesium_polylepis.1
MLSISPPSARPWRPAHRGRGWITRSIVRASRRGAAFQEVRPLRRRLLPGVSAFTLAVLFTRTGGRSPASASENRPCRDADGAEHDAG